MQLNYFAAVRLTLALLPKMTEKAAGHVINVSSIGVLTSAPRFSAYVASKAALEAWTRCAAAEYYERGVHFTVINFPLVRTPMISPTKIYDQAQVLTPGTGRRHDRRGHRQPPRARRHRARPFRPERSEQPRQGSG